jgi:beta-glucanase (GH16 family)
VVVVSACGATTGPTVTPPSPWTLVWSDDFEGSSGALPDPAKWVLETGTGPNKDGWGNAELETYTARPENVSLDGQGHLVVTAKREALDGAQFTSARLTTQGLFTAKYGKLEARLKLPNAKGLWPAFWMLGANLATHPWPACGEIDVMELRGNVPQTAIGSLHGPEYFGGSAISKKFTLAQGTFDQDFHVFAVQWDPALISFSVDDQIYQTVNAQTLLAGQRTWVYDHAFFVILNLAVGGTFLGSTGQPDSNTTFPQTMTVDWVRAWQRVP